MQALPIFLISNIATVSLLAEEISPRKVTMLLKADAEVTVFSPEICHELQDLVEAKKIKYEKENF